MGRFRLGRVVRAAQGAVVLGAAVAGGAGSSGAITLEAVHSVRSSSVDGVAPGDLLITTFSFDPGTPDGDPSPLHGLYSFGAGLSVAVGNGDQGLTLIENVAYIADMLSAAQDQIADEAQLSTSDDRRGLSLRLVLAFVPSAFPDDGLPTFAPGLDGFLEERSSYDIRIGNGVVSAGDLQSLRLVATPTPPAFLVMSAPVLFLVLRQRLARCAGRRSRA
jgi:hypothetical protein